MTGPQQDLGSDRVADLLSDALTAMTTGGDHVAPITELFTQGSKVDALAFVSGCMSMIREMLPPGSRADLAVGRVTETGDVEVIDRDPEDCIPAAILLASRCLVDWLADDQEAAWERWLAADESVAAGALGALLRQTAVLVRQARARLN